MGLASAALKTSCFPPWAPLTGGEGHPSAWATLKHKQLSPYGLATGGGELINECSLCGANHWFSNVNMHKYHLKSLLKYYTLAPPPIPTRYSDLGDQGGAHEFARIIQPRWCQCSSFEGHTWRTSLPCSLYSSSETLSAIEGQPIHRNDQHFMCFCNALPQSFTPVSWDHFPNTFSKMSLPQDRLSEPRQRHGPLTPLAFNTPTETYLALFPWKM